MSTRIYIYALCEPITEEIRYVGKTRFPSKRLKWHIRNSKYTQTTHKDFWIGSLLSDNLIPVFLILEVVHPWQDWQEREKFWIAHYRQLNGERLTNTRAGGEGIELSDEARLEMSRAGRGKPKSVQHRKRIGDANRNPSQETRDRMSEWQKGTTRPSASDATRLKMRMAHLRRLYGPSLGGVVLA